MTDEIDQLDNSAAKLTPKQRVFLEAYLSCWNAAEAARRAGYAHADRQGPRLLRNVVISEAVERRVSEMAMTANEVLIRLAQHARGDMGDFLDITSMGFVVDLSGAVEKGLTHLIKKVRQRTTISTAKDGAETEVHDMEIELYDAQSALVQLGRHHKLFTDKIENVNRSYRVTMDGEEIEDA